VAVVNRTATYPRDQRGYQCGPDLATAIGIFGTGKELVMLAGQDSFTFGRADTCNLQVEDKHVASAHACITRIVNSRASLRVSNVSSGKNDIVYNGEIAEREFEMGAGDWFQIGDVRYVILNEEMRLVRSQLMHALGVRQHVAIDELLIASVRDSARPILLLGEPGCDQNNLASVIHQVSHRRHNRFYPLPERAKLDNSVRQELLNARNGTVLVHVHQRGKLDSQLVAALIHPDAELRLVLSARSADKAEASFPPDLMHDTKKIKIPPLRERTAELPELMDLRFLLCRSPLRFALLRTELRESLRAHTWPGNLEELRVTVDNLAQLAHYRSRGQAERESPLTRSKLRGWIKKLTLNLKFPLLPQDTE
jgi:hypothetical protein